MLPFYAGRFGRAGFDPSAGGGGGYTGPKDVSGAAVAWYGLRSYSAAYATGSNPAVDLVDQAGANAITININSSGNLDVSAITAWVTAHSVTTILVTKVYDQQGTNHMNQVALGSMPALILSAFGSHPAISVDAATPRFITGGSVTQAQTFTQSIVSRQVTAGGLGQVFGNSAASPGVFYNGANTAVIWAGGSFSSVTASDSTPHSITGFYNNTSSSIAIDGGAPTGSLTPGTDGFSSAQMCISESSFPSTSYFFEGGLWAGSITDPGSNAKTYWGY